VCERESGRRRETNQILGRQRGTKKHLWEKRNERERKK